MLFAGAEITSNILVIFAPVFRLNTKEKHSY